MSRGAAKKPWPRLVDQAACAEHPATGRYHQHLFELYRAKTDAFERMLLAIAGGALFLSMAFVEKLAGSHPRSAWVLGMAWALLGLSLIVILCSIRCSAESMLHATKTYPWHEETGELGGVAAKVVRVANSVAIGTVGAGIALLATFAYLNLGRL